MSRKFLALAMILMAASLFADPTISDLKVRPCFPWGQGKADVRFSVSGVATGSVCFLCGKAKDLDRGTEMISQAFAMRLPSNGVYHVVWDTGKDLGIVDMTRLKLALAIDTRECVQLWPDGPYWAEMNVGATHPWEPGYYFWWGDTKGYERQGNLWVASDGSVAGFQFSDRNTPTYGKDNATLRREGWITDAGNLAPEHDAAAAHWGGGWRMPTLDEIDALIANTTTEWATTNGVPGRLFKGKGAYSSASIFLPVTGNGYLGGLYNFGSYGYYWSSTPDATHPTYAWYLYFNAGSSFRDSYYRFGQPVRPIRSYTE